MAHLTHSSQPFSQNCQTEINRLLMNTYKDIYIYIYKFTYVMNYYELTCIIKK